MEVRLVGIGVDQLKMKLIACYHQAAFHQENWPDGIEGRRGK
jgi:hypothetical protein